MSDVQGPSPKLLKRAIDDRDRRPWRYYLYERDDLKRFLDQLRDKLDAAEVVKLERITRLTARVKELEQAVAAIAEAIEGEL